LQDEGAIMFHTHRTALGTGLVTALVLGATIAPGALAMPTDLRSPDVRDAAAGGQVVLSGAPSWPANPQPVVRPRVVVSSSDPGFDWGSAGIGAGTVVGAFAIALTGTVALRRRRRPSEAL
jgi:hypothetical protein